MEEQEFVQGRQVIRYIRCMHCGMITGDIAMTVYDNIELSKTEASENGRGKAAEMEKMP